MDVGGFVSHLVTVGTGAEGLVWLGLEVLRRWETEGGRERGLRQEGDGAKGREEGDTLAMERWWCQRKHIEGLEESHRKVGEAEAGRGSGEPGDLTSYYPSTRGTVQGQSDMTPSCHSLPRNPGFLYRY